VRDVAGHHRGQGTRLQVNPIACDGIGICGHLAADLVRFDTWGYPIPTDRPLRGREIRTAKAAISACPRRALFLTAQPARRPPGGSG
jgi:ferredoxin